MGNDGQLTGIKARGSYDASNILLETDMVIEAIGQEPGNIKHIADLNLDENNCIITDSSSGTTSIDKIYAAGDIVNTTTVVDAISAGKRAARNIDEKLSTERTTPRTKTTKAIKQQPSLEIEFCGVKCENPFFLSSSPVGSNYEMCAKALDTGWGGIVYKTIGKFIADECSPRFDNNSKEGTPFVGFKNMEQISDKPLEKNLEMMAKLKKNYPEKMSCCFHIGIK